MLKRVFDFILSGVSSLIFLPFFMVIAIVIRLDSKGPVFYLQERVGRGGRSFRIFKFRSMVPEADQVGGYSTSQNDPRVTRVGAVLRKMSLDELPQLINVVVGDMSLVGPRPDVPAQRSLYSESDWQQRHSVRPGITGLAQATVRSNAAPGERLKLDLEYVAEQSLWLDLKILIMTVAQVFAKGSY